jgi:hypothetical protein
MSETSLIEQLQPRVGGLVRVVTKNSAVDGLSMGKIGLLLSAEAESLWVVEDVAVVKLLIDGSVRILVVYPHEIELIGAEDAK